MWFGKSKNKLTPIAVDFGTDSVKLLQCTTDASPRVFAAAARVVPHDLRDDADARRAWLTDAIAELTRVGGFSGRQAIASVPTPLTVVEHLRVVDGAEAAVHEQIAQDLGQRMSVDPGRLVVRHVQPPSADLDVSGKREVIAMAVGRGAIMHHIDILKAAKLTVVGMHVEPAAMMQAFAHLFRRATDQAKTSFFVDVGSRVTKALIAHGPAPAFTKLVQVGGEHFDQQFARELDVEIGEARDRRRRQARDLDPATAAGATGPNASGGAPAGHRPDGGGSAAAAKLRKQVAVTSGETSHEMIPAGGEMLDCLIDELQLCVSYHNALYSQRRIDRIVFLGGEANQRAMCRRIASELRLPGTLGDPLARMVGEELKKAAVGVDLTQSQPNWAVPLGLTRLPANL